MEIHRGSSYMGMFNLREPQKSANDATLKTVKKYKIFQCIIYCSASRRSSGLAEIQTGTWGGGPENDEVGQLLQIATALSTSFIWPSLLFWSCGGWPAKVGSLLSRQMYVGGPHGLPKRICGLGTKNRQQQNPVYRPRLTSHLVWSGFYDKT